jgi:hypothetical protein
MKFFQPTTIGMSPAEEPNPFPRGGQQLHGMSVNKQPPDGPTNQASTEAHQPAHEREPGITRSASVLEPIPQATNTPTQPVEFLEEAEAHVAELTQALYAAMEADSPTLRDWL